MAAPTCRPVGAMRIGLPCMVTYMYIRDMFITWYSYLYPLGDASVGLGGLLGQVYVGDDNMY